jgi:hypothetical protein
MKPTLSLLTALLLAPLAALHAAAPDLSKIVSRPDLDAVIAVTSDAPLKQALSDHALPFSPPQSSIRMSKPSFARSRAHRARSQKSTPRLRH